MAAGDITACRILATGWEAEIDISGLSTGGTYAMDGSGATLTDTSTAKLVFTVVSEGYNSSGILGTKTRTVYGTRARQKAYPDQATAQESAADGTLTVTVALSDYIYDDDKNGGAGTSGTDPVLVALSGFYTGSNAHAGLTCTNNSTADYPKVIARWAVVPYQRVTTTFDLEVVAFHHFAENAKPVACVKFSCDDGQSPPIAPVPEMTKSAAADGLPCYVKSINASDYSDNTLVTFGFQACPWVGDENSVADTQGGSANSLTLGPLPLFADSDDDYGVTVACVNTDTGVDSTGEAVDIGDYQYGVTLPYLTIRAALADIAAYNNTNHSRNNADFGIIYLQSDDHAWGNGTGSAVTTNGWVTVTRDPNVLKANARIAGTTGATVVTSLLRIADVTLVPSGAFIAGGTGRTLWEDSVAISCATQIDATDSYNYPIIYATFCTSNQLNHPWGTSGSSNVAALIRGCTATNFKTLGSGDYHPRCLLTSSFDHANSLAGSLWNAAEVNTICAYNADLANPAAASAMLSATSTVTGDVAYVCNLLERTNDGPIGTIWADGAVDANNVLLWHNTLVGGRCNLGYNWTANPYRTQFSLKYNAIWQLCTKHDLEATNGTYIKAWSVFYGVGWVGNHNESLSYGFGPKYGGIGWTTSSAAGFTNDNSYTDAGAGNGNYLPAAGSALLGKIPSALGRVIPYDMTGTAYLSGGSAGAYEGATAPSPGGYRFWTYS